MECYEKDRFDTIEAIKDAFESNNIPEIISVYLYGPLYKDNKLNLLHNIVIFVKTNQEKMNIEFITKLKDFRKKIHIKKEEEHYAVNLISIFTLEEIKSPDFLKYNYFWVLDFLLNHHCIYGKKLESEFLEIFKKMSVEIIKDNIRSYFSNTGQHLPETFSQITPDDSFDYILNEIYFNFCRYFLLLERENNLDLIEDISKKSLKELYEYVNDLFIKAKNLDFKKIYEDNQKLEITTGEGTGCVVYNPELKKILILEKDYKGKFWEVPKGGIEKGESIEDTIRRELQEETGITEFTIIKNIKLPYVNYGYKTIKNPYLFRKVKINYVFCETKEKEIKLSSEHTGYKWINPEEINNYNIHLSVQYVINCCNLIKPKSKFSLKNIFK